MTPNQVLEEIIQAYRITIYERYQFQDIKKHYDIPETINEETVNQLRDYFLNYIYPEASQRKELNEAFDSLDDYIKHPHKLIGILSDAIKLVFKYGIHLPKILSAGFDAMKTFQAATKFENNLVKEAINNKIEAPFDEKKINALIKLLSRQEIEEFIQISESLFEILHDRVLIEKIKEVIEYLIAVMKRNETLYTQNQIQGLEIGYEMIIEGDKLFNKLSKEDQLSFVILIKKIENDNLDNIFSN